MKTQYILYMLLVIILPVAIFFGCHQSEHIKPEPTQQPLAIEEANKIVSGLDKYHKIKGNFPKSKEDFQEFCLESRHPCRTVDFRKISWKSVDDKMIDLIYTSDEYSFPITLEIDSDSSDLIDKTQHKLKKEMQELTEDQQ